MNKITRQICGTFHSTSDVPIKDKNGRLLTTENEQKARWTHHLKEILNRPAPDEEAIVIEAVRYLEINISVPETRNCISYKSIKN